MKRYLESESCFLMNCCNFFSMLWEKLPRYSSLKVKWLQVWVWVLGGGENFLFKNCLLHLSIKQKGYQFLIRVVLIDWSSESIFRYELQIVKERWRRLLIKLRFHHDRFRRPGNSVSSNDQKDALYSLRLLVPILTEICQTLLMVSVAYGQGRIQKGKICHMNLPTSHFQKHF